MKLVLYTYWRSSSAYRVRLALAAKGLAYESVAVDLLGAEHTKGEYREKNPIGQVPTLSIDGKPMVESVAIVELLEELFPSPPLYPNDAWGRARVRSLVETINANTQPLQNMNVLARLSDDKEVKKAWARHYIERGLGAFEALMALHAQAGVSGRFAYGDAMGVADCFLVPQIYNAKRYGVDYAKFVRLAAAYAVAVETEAAKAAAPEKQADAPSTPA
jgi:maleylacetoacetate isomerase